MSSHPLITIIGAGPAGLACARSLHEQKLDFTILSPNLGGKITYGPGKVPYGSYYIHQTYQNFLPLTTFRKRVWPWHGMVLGKDSRINWRSVLSSADILKMARLRNELFSFQKEYETFKERSLEIGQVNALKENDYLISLFHKSGQEFLASLIPNQSTTFQLIEGNLKGFTFCSLEDISALEALKYARNFILPSYTFHFDPVNFCKPFSEKIRIGEAKKITKVGDEFRIETADGNNIISKVVIDATNRSGNVVLEGVEIEEGFKPNVSSFLYHVKGRRNLDFEKYRFYGFTDSFDRNLLALTQERDGSSLLYVRERNDEYLKHFFSDSLIVSTKNWKNCMTMGKSRNLTPERVEPGFIRAGAHLFEGIEDAWISGMYAALIACQHLNSSHKKVRSSAA